VHPSVNAAKRAQTPDYRPVHEIQEARQTLTALTLGVHRQQVVAVFEHQQPRLPVFDLIVVIEQHAHEIAGVVAKEGVRVQHVLQKNVPGALAGEGAKRRSLTSAGRPVPQN